MPAGGEQMKRRAFLRHSGTRDSAVVVEAGDWVALLVLWSAPQLDRAPATCPASVKATQLSFV